MNTYNSVLAAPAPPVKNYNYLPIPADPDKALQQEHLPGVNVNTTMPR